MVVASLTFQTKDSFFHTAVTAGWASPSPLLSFAKSFLSRFLKFVTFLEKRYEPFLLTHRSYLPMRNWAGSLALLASPFWGKPNLLHFSSGICPPLLPLPVAFFLPIPAFILVNLKNPQPIFLGVFEAIFTTWGRQLFPLFLYLANPFQICWSPPLLESVCFFFSKDSTSYRFSNLSPYDCFMGSVWHCPWFFPLFQCYLLGSGSSLLKKLIVFSTGRKGLFSDFHDFRIHMAPRPLFSLRNLAPATAACSLIGPTFSRFCFQPSWLQLVNQPSFSSTSSHKPFWLRPIALMVPPRFPPCAVLIRWATSNMFFLELLLVLFLTQFSQSPSPFK